MTNIKDIYEDVERQVQFFPRTHTKAVVDDNGNTVESRLEEIKEIVNQKQYSVGAVQYDSEPTSGSTKYVTSNGVKTAIDVVDAKAMVETDVPNLKSSIVWEVGSLSKTGTDSTSENDIRTKEIQSFDDWVHISFGTYRYSVRIAYYNNDDTFLYYQTIQSDFFIAPNTKFRFTIWGAGNPVSDIYECAGYKRLSMLLGGYTQRANYFKGVTFNNMGYDGDGASSDSYSSSVAIPIPDGVSSIMVKGTMSNLANLVCFLDSSYSKITSYNQKTSEMDANGYRTVSVPNDAVYYYVQFGINSNSSMNVKNASNDEVIWTPIDSIRDTIPVNEAIIDLRENVDGGSVGGKTFSEYEDYMNQINYSSLVLLHFSDIHNSKSNLLRIMNFADKYESKIDDILNTGDTVGSKWDSGISFFTDVEGHEKILNVIGNHDSSSTGSGNWDYYTAAQCYERYIEPFVENWNVTIGEDVCYYYKDYPANIRMIVLDRMHWDSAQETWFTTLLQNSLSKKVIIASHGTPATIAPSDKACNMDSYFKETVSPNSGMNSDSVMVTAVDDFIDAGGTFICWLGGHTHWDAFRYVTGHPRQLCVLVGTASVNANGNAYYREAGMQSEDNFNIFSVYPTAGTFAIKKIGCSYNRMGLSTSGLVYDYVNRQILMEY